MTGQKKIDKPLIRRQMNPYSRNEIPLGCLMQLPEAKRWIKTEEAWFDFESAETSANKSLKGLTLRIQMVGVTQKLGKATFGRRGKNLARVVEGTCSCGRGKKNSWPVWTHTLHTQWLKAFSKGNYKNSNPKKLNSHLRLVCDKLAKFCDGKLDRNSCRVTQRRYMSRRIFISKNRQSQC